MNKKVSSPAELSKKSELSYRLIFNSISILILTLLLIFAEVPLFRPFFTLAVALVQAIALIEFYRMARKKKLKPAVALGAVASICYVFTVFLKTQAPYSILNLLLLNSPSIILALTVFACFFYYAFRKDQPLINISVTFFGIIYITVPMALFVAIVYFFHHQGASQVHFQGTWWLLYLIAVTKSSDTGAYFVGRSLGKHKLAAKLSPKKTLEGAVGGLLASVFFSVLICYLGRLLFGVFYDFSYFQAIYLGLIIGIGGQIGDLAESLIKRDAQIKDSNSIPGVGGILDMIDSLLFTAPIVYIFLKIHYSL